MTQGQVQQRTARGGREMTHTHGKMVHTHDHYHLTHHPGGIVGEFHIDRTGIATNTTTLAHP